MTRDTAPPAKPVHPGRSSARLSGVQALYQIELSNESAETVIAEFLRHGLGREVEGEALAEPDRIHFERMVRDATARAEELDALISPCLAERWTMARIGALPRALLRAAACELVACPDVPARVVIDEYVELARAFFSGDEPAFVNGALDTLARRLRPREFTGNSGGTSHASGTGDVQSASGR